MTCKEEPSAEETPKDDFSSEEEPSTDETPKDSLGSEEGKEENSESSKLEADDKKIDYEEQTSPRDVVEIPISSGTDFDGSSSNQMSSIDQPNTPNGIEKNSESSKLEADDSKECADQTSPRGVLEIPISTTYSDGGTSSSSSEVSSVDQSVTPYKLVSEPQSLQWRNLIGRFISRKKKSMMRVATFPPATTSSGFRRCLEKIRIAKDQTENRITMPEFEICKPTWRSFDYQELATATDGFNPDKLIGKGGHAEVYRGCLSDGQLVAVKRLTKGNNEEDRVADFLSELGIIAHVNHSNAAQLLGFSVEGGLHLVLQFSPHGSLASVLHGSKEGLDWKVRFNIAIGVAEGLLYLHEGCHRRIIHRDIKASNILLTEDYQPQISDFGLAKWLPDNWPQHIVFPIEGTFGYLAPEYFMHGLVNEKTDVFAFGVLLLELVTGRKAVDSSRQSLVIWAKPLLDSNNVKDLADPSLGDAYDVEEMTRALAVATMCIHHLSNSRPSMNLVVRLLRGDEGSVELIGREMKPKVATAPLFDACDSEDYTCSRYLNDLHRHKQLALEQ
ncbi:receptor-like cytosolic serine/threonine-protein kinase RBK1 isoform X1 [Typha angustifolia]|uniref:receptor-like cytosolic serine/threonine-protein kinase RBK1 isoform X1 n=2 Tax=Typha angustifolia TaxID=59011 RepID=UPI003C2D0F9C